MNTQYIKENVRKLGYQLAVREIYGENTPDYYKQKRAHGDMLHKLYKLEKRTRGIVNFNA